MRIRLGQADRLPCLVFAALTALVALTPLGKEATHPFVLGLYRALLFVIVFAAGAGRLRARGDGRRICPYFLGTVVLYVLLTAVSVLVQPGSHFEGTYVFYEHALFIAAFIALAAFNRNNDSKWKFAVLIMVPLAGALYVAAAVAVGGRPLFGPFVNPNYFASYLLAGLAAALALAAFGAGRMRIYALGAAVLLGYGIVETASRGAALAALLMLAVAMFRWRARALGAMAVTAALAIVYLLAPQTTVMRKFLDRGAGDPYNYARPLIWKGALQIVAQHPLLGIGPGRYAYASKLFTPAIDGTVARYRKFPNIAHSEYLQTMAASGIPAAILMVLLILYLGHVLWSRGAVERGNRLPSGGGDRGEIEGRSPISFSKSVNAPRFPPGPRPQTAVDSLGGEAAKPAQEAAILAGIGVAAHALVDNNWTAPVLAATLAIVSQADLLPWRVASENGLLSLFGWTPARRVLAFAAIGAVFAHSTLIPVAGLYFNEAGHRAFTTGEFQRAELLHALAVGVVPDHPVFLDNLGMVYLDEFTRTRKPEHLELSKSAFAASIAANPDFDIPAGHLETAWIQSLTGNIREDRPIHENIVATDRHLLAVNPFNPFIRRNLAEALYNLGDRAAAERELLGAVTIEPNYVPGYLRLAEWHAEGGEKAKSAAYTAMAVTIANRYRDKKLDPFEALLLGRPEPRQ